MLARFLNFVLSMVFPLCRLVCICYPVRLLGDRCSHISLDDVRGSIGHFTIYRECSCRHQMMVLQPCAPTRLLLSLQHVHCFRALLSTWNTENPTRPHGCQVARNDIASRLCLQCKNPSLRQATVPDRLGPFSNSASRSSRA